MGWTRRGGNGDGRVGAVQELIKPTGTQGPPQKWPRVLFAFPFLSLENLLEDHAKEKGMYEGEAGTNMTFFLLTANASSPSIELEASYQCQGAMELGAGSEEMPVLEMQVWITMCSLPQPF